MSPRELFNIGLNIGATIVFLLLLVASLVSGGIRRKADRYLISLNIVAGISSAFNIAYSFVIGSNQLIVPLVYAYRIIISIAYFTLAVIAFIYTLSYFEFSKKTKAIAISVVGFIFILALVVLFINTFNNVYFFIRNDRVVLTKLNILNYIYPTIIFVTAFVFSLVSKGRFIEKFSFGWLLLIPVIGYIFDYFFQRLSINSFSLIAAVLIHYLFYYIERGRILAEQSKKLQEQQTNLMISQIQPHFIYNCLSSISYLCKKDPDKAEQAIDDFSLYLRHNFSNISESKLVPFEKEVEHTQNYLKLEKLRFGEKIKTEFDLKVTNFYIPSLSLQPMVENAVKHGITKKIEGGTIKISSREDMEHIYVRIEDDGVGVDFSTLKHKDERVHLGIENTKDRLVALSKGTLTISSIPNVGTTVIITIPKNKTNLGG